MIRLLKREHFWEILFVVPFFIVETFTKDELTLTVLVIGFGILFFIFPKERKVKIWLWLIGLVLGTLIEVVMGFWGRSQFWTYGSLFGVPLWLPFIWGLGFEVIYTVGLFMRSITKSK